ncbi:hypothetical protein KEM60_00329 [Austwickia sp. TVS 96-490-7B]|nr:hypothetical protein [Austwickia sp. TVS 96-490-7B]
MIDVMSRLRHVRYPQKTLRKSKYSAAQENRVTFLLTASATPGPHP